MSNHQVWQVDAGMVSIHADPPVQTMIYTIDTSRRSDAPVHQAKKGFEHARWWRWGSCPSHSFGTLVDLKLFPTVGCSSRTCLSDPQLVLDIERFEND